MNKTILSILSATMAFAVSAADLPPLFADGKTEWKIALEPNAGVVEKFAAEEFASVFQKMFGAKIATLKSGESCEHKVRIFAPGNTWDDEIAEYRLEGGDLLLTGNQPRAALHATYAFLQRELDVRWLWPGDDGEFIQHRDSWSFPKELNYRHTPSIRYRGFHHCGDWRDRKAFNLWQTRNFSTIHRHGVSQWDRKYGQYSMASSHNVDLAGDEEFFRAHQEAYALVNGKRRRNNLCYSCPLGAERVVERMEQSYGKRLDSGVLDILSIFPADNQDYCQCDTCKAAGVSTSWFSFYNQIANALRKNHPNAHFSTIAYQGYLPSPKVKIDNTDFVEYAFHNRDFNRLWNDPRSSNNRRELKNIQDWRSEHPEVELGSYTYPYDVNRFFIPFFSMIDDDIAFAASNRFVTYIPGVNLHPATGPLNETSFARNRPTIALHCWKTWNAEMTLDDFLDDWCRHAYGPAAPELKEYFKLLDAAEIAMKDRLMIFSDVNRMCVSLLDDAGLRTKIDALFAAAEKKTKDEARFAANVEWEKTIYRQLWTVRGSYLGEIENTNATRKVVYFLGENPWGSSNAGKKIADARITAEKLGWKLIAATNETALAEHAGEAMEYVMEHATASKISPETQKVIRENVLGGGTLLVSAAFQIPPLNKILGDDGFKVKLYKSKIAPQDRKVTYKRGGDAWQVPYDIRRALWGTAPGATLVPAEPTEGWITYAAFPGNDDPKEDIPFVSAHPYGKGVIIITSSMFGCGRFKLIENIRNDLSIKLPD